MKRALLVTGIFLISLSTSAQGVLFDKNENFKPFSKPKKVISLPDNSWAIGGWEGDCIGVFLVSIAASGNTGRSQYGPIGQWITDLEYYRGKIYSAGLYYGEDDVSQPDEVSIMIRDTNHNLFYDTTVFPLLESHLFPLDSITGTLDSSNLYYDNNFQIAVIDSDDILVSVVNYLALIHPSNWSVQWTKPFKSYINDILVSLPYIYLATDSGLIQTDTSGNIIRTLPIVPVTHSYQSESSENYFIGDTLVFSIDSTLNILHSYDLHNTFKYWNGLTGNNGRVLMCGRDIADTAFIMAVFDSSLAMQNTFALTGQCRLPVDIAASDSTIIVVNYRVPIIGYPLSGATEDGDSIFDATYTTYSFAGACSLSSSNASVVSAILDTFKILPGVPPLYADSLSFSILIKNTGPDTINDIILASNPLTAMNCADEMTFQYYDGLSLGPEDTITLHNFILGFWAGEPLLLQVYVFSINLSPPVNRCDTAYSQFGPFLIEGINSRSNSSNLKISPNPTDGIFNIQADVTSDVIFSLYDLSGKLLLEQNLVNANTQLNIHPLAAGMYIYSIKSGSQIPFAGKLVKE